MQLDFMTRGVLAGVGIAIVAGPLGCVMMWRRMSNFGDTLAHSTLLGLCLSLVLDINLYVGVVTISLLMSVCLAFFSRQKYLSSDTILCILAYGSLAAGLLSATLLPNARIDLLGYLYGDILAVDNHDLLWILCVDVLVLSTLIKIWRALLSITVHEDLAKIEGIKVQRTHWIFILLLALVFAIAMKLIGVLLITALLLIPAAAARQFGNTVEKMATISSIFGIIAVFGGLSCSQQWDWPAGPAIVVIAVAILCVSLVSRKIKTHLLP
jgi:zinc transport system permease protein